METGNGIQEGSCALDTTGMLLEVGHPCCPNFSSNYHPHTNFANCRVMALLTS